MTVDDAGYAGAVIVANPGPHTGKTYHITGPAFSSAEQAAALSAATGKTIEYVQVRHPRSRRWAWGGGVWT